jgi:hypothetical protein
MYYTRYKDNEDYIYICSDKKYPPVVLENNTLKSYFTSEIPNKDIKDMSLAFKGESVQEQAITKLTYQRLKDANELPDIFETVLQSDYTKLFQRTGILILERNESLGQAVIKLIEEYLITRGIRWQVRYEFLESKKSIPDKTDRTLTEICTQGYLNETDNLEDKYSDIGLYLLCDFGGGFYTKDAIALKRFNQPWQYKADFRNTEVLNTILRDESTEGAEKIADILMLRYSTDKLQECISEGVNAFLKKYRE